MKKIGLLVFMMMISTLLTGCLFPDDQKAQKQIPYETQLQLVQTAVNQYQENTGVLPIKNKEANTPIYEKYPVDFQKLVPKYMEEPPANSFEGGGIYQYVLINPETNPEVKLIQLENVGEVQKLQVRLDVYKREHGYPPYKDVLPDGVFTLDYKKLGLKEEPHVISPYSKKNLPLMIDKEGKVFIDYRMDLYEIIKENQIQEGEDIRPYLVENSPFVPVYSKQCVVKNGELILIEEK
ncbi:hypothetical protein [Massilibacterium senegalense]|uniref:hypothetical protein n=1 Tax=Massilibacterium senegalense TaxID=1632858 RepID=UPI000783EB91|nr:hypothetical protein [Massilibacterium senegalense]